MIKVLNKTKSYTRRKYADYKESVTYTFDKNITKEHFEYFLSTKGISTQRNPEEWYETYYTVSGSRNIWVVTKVDPYTD